MTVERGLAAKRFILRSVGNQTFTLAFRQKAGENRAARKGAPVEKAVPSPVPALLIGGSRVLQGSCAAKNQKFWRLCSLQIRATGVIANLAGGLSEAYMRIATFNLTALLAVMVCEDVAQAQPTPLPENTIPCEAFKRSPDGVWRVDEPVTFDVGFHQGNDASAHQHSSGSHCRWGWPRPSSVLKNSFWP